MRILTILDNLKAGGTQRTAQNCAIGYLRQGHDSAVLAYLGGGPREKPITDAGCTLFVGTREEFKGSSRAPAVEAAADWKPDVVHLHRRGSDDPDTGRILTRLRERLGRRIPAIETNHFGRPDYSPDRDLIDLHVQISPWCLWAWGRWTSRMKPRPLGVMVPHLVDPKAFRVLSDEQRRAARDEFGLPHDAFVCGRTGQAVPLIWPAGQIEAFRIAAQQRKDLWLALAGFPDQLKPQIDQLPSDIRRRVVLVPFITGDDERLNRFYNTFDVFLHITRIGESFGLVLCEAQLAGAPCVSLSTPTKGNSQTYVVGHERGGLIAADVPSAAQAVLKLADDRALLKRLQIQGAEWVRRECDPERIISKFIQILALTREAPNREALTHSLTKADFVTEVNRSQLDHLFAHMIGRHSRGDLMMTRLVTDPLLYKIYMRIIRLWRN